MLERCLTAAVLIFVIALFRLIAARRIPKRIICVLWIAAALYLLFPFRISSAFNLYALLPKSRPVARTDLSVPVSDILRGTAGEMPAVSSAVSRNTGSRLPGVIYTVVCCMIGLWVLLTYVLGMLRLHSGKPDPDPMIKKWRAQHPLRRPLKILSSDRVSVPISGGLLFPVILLPADRGRCSDRELECVLTHEYLHVCHLDALWKLLFSACLCLFWFHPAVWVMVILAERDIEYACDEAVLATGIRPKDYGSSLIRMELRRSDRPALSNSFVAGKLLHRVNRITGDRTLKPVSWIVGTLLAGLILAFFATGPVRGEDVTAEAEAVAVQTVPTATAFRWETGPGPENVGLFDNHPMPEEDASLTDPYYCYQFLGEMTDVPLDELEAASSALKQQYNPHLLRITSTDVGEFGGLQEISYKIRVYDFMENNND